MNRTTATLDLGELGECQVEVYFHYTAAKRNDPGVGATAELINVVFSGRLDILELLSAECVADLSAECIEAYEDDLACAIEDRHARKYNQQCH